MKFFNKNKEGLFRSIFTAYIILILHVVLLAGIGLTILLFKGVYDYLPWIMGSIGILILGIAGVFYYRLKNSTSDIRSILSMPEFKDRTVEIKLLGGLASFKINAAADTLPRIEHYPDRHTDQFLLEHDINHTEKKLLKLTALYEKELISKEEFEKAKQNILQG